MEIVVALPSVMLPTDGTVLRGIVGNCMVTAPLAVPKDEVMLKSPLNESVNCLVPSALCAMVKSPYAAALVEALSVKTVIYFFPSALAYAVSYCVVKSEGVGIFDVANPRFWRS